MTTTISPQIAVEVSAPEAIKSKYSITDIPGGFLVQRQGGLEVGVTYGDTYIHVGTQSVALYQYPALVDMVGEWFMDRLVSGYLNKRKRKEGTSMIARALSKRMKPNWQRLIREFVPTEVADLARLMWSSAHGDATILHKPELYTDTYLHLRSDLKRYHACRLIAKREESLHSDGTETPSLIERAALWRQLYATNALSPKAFNKTLDKLPRALSFHSIDQLINVHIEQPITNRLHLIAVLSGAEHFHWYMHEPIVLRATGDMIQEASGPDGVPRLKSSSRTKDISAFMRLVLDYPIPFHGNFLGLARRSHEWHRDNNILPDQHGLSADARLPLLTLDYDALAKLGIQPLRTVGEVVQEGDDMGHCVGSYASPAHKGYSFLFHVEHEKQKATIELSPEGSVRQAYGPRNTINSACHWGTQQLAQATRQTDVRVVPAIPF